MAESDPPHPLKGADLDKCYDVMMAERTALITAKRETEDELIRTLIKLSSASLLLIPGLLFAKDATIASMMNEWLRVGAMLFVFSLLTAMLEQFLSSKAYDRQIKISVDYYQQKSTVTSDEKFSNWLRLSQTFAFAFFAAGVFSSGMGIWKIGEPVTMSDKSTPSPPPRPSPPPPQPSYPGYKDGGRSVPPSAPPPPPKR